MTDAVPAAAPARPYAAWVLLALAWGALLVPASTRTLALAGVVLAIVGGVLALLAARRGSRAAWAALAAALVVTPLLWLRAPSTPAAGDALAATGTPAATPADGPGLTPKKPSELVTGPRAVKQAPMERTPAAFRPTFTAVEVASYFQPGPPPPGPAIGKQPLLLSGVVADAAGGTVHLTANDYPPVEVRGLKPAFASTLAAGQQVLLACDSAHAVDGKPVAEGCGPAP